MMVTVDMDTLEQMIRRVMSDFMATKTTESAAPNGSASYARRAAAADENMRRKLASKARKAA